MSLFGSPAKSKSKTAPSTPQNMGVGTIYASFLPWGPGGVQDRDLNKGWDNGELPPAGTVDQIGYDNQYAPYRQYVANYNPFAFNAAGQTGRPGGPSSYDTGLLNKSLYGTTAPLQMSGMQNANQQYQSFLQSMYGGGYGGGSAAPYGGGYGTGYQGYGSYGPTLGGGSQGYNSYGMSNYPTGWNPNTQPGRNYNYQTGTWDEVSSGADVTWDAGTNQYYYKGTPITEGEVQAGLQGGPDAIETMLLQRMGGPSGGQAPIEMFGQQALNAIGLGNQYYQRPPDRPEYDAADYGIGMLDRLQGQGALDKYVQGALSGTRSAFKNELAEQLGDLQSKYAYEGGFLGSPMFSAMGELSGDLTASYLRDIGNLELQAANDQMNRIFGLAGQGMGTQADFLSSTYGDEMSAFSKMMSDTSGARASIINNAMNLMQQGYADNFEQAAKMAVALQQNEQSALDSMRENYYTPGDNLLNLMSPLLGVTPRSTSKTKGADGGIMGDIGAGVGIASDVLSFF